MKRVGVVLVQFIAVSFFMAVNSIAQETDSIRTLVLNEIVIQGIKVQADTLENFYKSNPSATTENILSRMNGVSLMRRGAFGQEPIIRGLSSGQINITIDGMKIFGACTDKMDPVSIYVEPSNLYAIQAQTGNQSAEFGSTFGGSLNMILAEPIVGRAAQNRRIGIDMQSASKATNAYSSFNFGRDESAYLVSMVYRKSQNYNAGGGKEILHSQYEKFNISTSGKWKLGKYDTLQANILFDQGRNIGFPALSMDVGKATAGMSSITYERFAPWKLLNGFKTKLYYNTVSHVMDDTQRENVAIHMDMPGKSKTFGGYAEGDVHFFHEHQTMMKLEYYANTVIGEMTMYNTEGSPMYMQTAPEATRSNVAYYVSQKWKLNQANKLLFTFRADMFSDYLHNGIGRKQVEVINENTKLVSSTLAKTIGINYVRNLSSNIKLEVQGGLAERAATLNERFGFYLFNRFDNYDYLGNIHLKRESSYQAEATLNYFGSKIELQFTPFIKHINNYIMGSVQQDVSSMTFGAKGVKQYTNINNARLKGFEMMMLANPFKNFQSITTLKYTYGRLSLNDAAPLIPPLKVVSTLRYSKKKLNSQMEIEWAAAQPHISKTFGELKTPSYFLINARAGYEISKVLTINTGAENIFDIRYREHLDWGGIPRQGRNIYLNLTLTF